MPATFIGWGFATHGVITSLSLTGAFVAVNDLPRQLPLATLRFAFPEDGPPLEVLARLVHRHTLGCGVEFLTLGREARAALWDRQVGLLPARFETCPFCYHPLNGEELTLCPVCLRRLDFRNGGYLEVLAASTPSHPEDLVGLSRGMQRVFDLINLTAVLEVPVLIRGPNGTGKQAVAQAIHRRSQVRDGPFIPVNCGHRGPHSLAGKLFGPESSTSLRVALQAVCPGVLSHGATLYLDDVGKLPLDFQWKLLQLSQGNAVVNGGSGPGEEKPLHIISATATALEPLVEQGGFLERLYLWLRTAYIDLPPLNERGQDVLLLATFYLQRYARQLQKPILGLSWDAARLIQAYDWPGNIDQLINRMQHAAVMSDGPWVEPADLDLPLAKVTGEPDSP